MNIEHSPYPEERRIMCSSASANVNELGDAQKPVTKFSVRPKLNSN